MKPKPEEKKEEGEKKPSAPRQQTRTQETKKPSAPMFPPMKETEQKEKNILDILENKTLRELHWLIGPLLKNKDHDALTYVKGTLKQHLGFVSKESKERLKKIQPYQSLSTFHAPVTKQDYLKQMTNKVQAELYKDINDIMFNARGKKRETEEKIAGYITLKLLEDIGPMALANSQINLDDLWKKIKEGKEKWWLPVLQKRALEYYDQQQATTNPLEHEKPDFLGAVLAVGDDNEIETLLDLTEEGEKDANLILNNIIQECYEYLQHPSFGVIPIGDIKKIADKIKRTCDDFIQLNEVFGAIKETTKIIPGISIMNNPTSLNVMLRGDDTKIQEFTDNIIKIKLTGMEQNKLEIEKGKNVTVQTLLTEERFATLNNSNIRNANIVIYCEPDPKKLQDLFKETTNICVEQQQKEEKKGPPLHYELKYNNEGIEFQLHGDKGGNKSQKTNPRLNLLDTKVPPGKILVEEMIKKLISFALTLNPKPEQKIIVTSKEEMREILKFRK